MTTTSPNMMNISPGHRQGWGSEYTDEIDVKGGENDIVRFFFAALFIYTVLIRHLFGFIHSGFENNMISLASCQMLVLIYS